MSVLASVVPARGFEVDLLQFEILHLKLLEVLAKEGVSVRYLGATSRTNDDRSKGFLGTAGSATWVVRREAIEGVDPATEMGRIQLLERPTEGAVPIQVGGKPCYLAFYDLKGVCANRPMTGLAFSAAKLVQTLNETRVDAKNGPGLSIPTH